MTWGACSRGAGALATAVWFVQTSAANQQSALNAAGEQAGRIEGLWWLFFWLLGAIFVVVMLLALRTLMRSGRGDGEWRAEANPAAETETRTQRVVTAGVVMSVLILFGLLFASVRAGKANADDATTKPALTVRVTGNQWWWQVEYLTQDASRTLVTANEIHIPMGRRVQVIEQSNDVIHSFWVPALNGKRDLIPSHITTETIEADVAGQYRGQCAEFCGLQHAHMAIWVVAEPEAKFEAWMNAQLQDAPEPSTPTTQRGRQVFLNNACVYCHAVRGTPAAGQNGPDLTHFGSRLGIAANTVPNTPGYLAGWILDPQSMKPGNQMATIAVPSQDLQPLVAYLESLK